MSWRTCVVVKQIQSNQPIVFTGIWKRTFPAFPLFWEQNSWCLTSAGVFAPCFVPELKFSSDDCSRLSRTRQKCRLCWGLRGWPYRCPTWCQLSPSLAGDQPSLSRGHTLAWSQPLPQPISSHSTCSGDPVQGLNKWNTTVFHSSQECWPMCLPCWPCSGSGKVPPSESSAVRGAKSEGSVYTTGVCPRPLLGGELICKIIKWRNWIMFYKARKWVVPDNHTWWLQ